ncbi:MAG: hypothetical protein JXN62_13835 [Bacteroidales bacterium]|nr:hypothetical protein [Bacteroidales bacterium]
MKKLVVLLLIMPSSILFSQKIEDCRVMVPALQGTYEGKCKNGLAQGKGTASGTDTYTGSFTKGFPNGKGVYIWASGDKYEGEWHMGIREGEGTYTMTLDGKDSVIVGIWKNDLYAGPKQVAPDIIQKYNVVSVSFKRTGEGSAITFSFYKNGMMNQIESLNFSANSGSENRESKYTYFNNVRFPFSCKVNYKSWNNIRTLLYDCILEFEITQPGNWDIRINN